MAQTTRPTVLIADDDQALVDMLRLRLEDWGYRVHAAANKVQLYQRLADEVPILLILDVRFGEHDGVEVLQQVLPRYPQVPVVMCTAHGTIDSAVSAIKLGAFDYLTKPVDATRLHVVVQHAVEKQTLSRRVEQLEKVVAAKAEGHPILGDSPAIQQLRQLIATIAPTDATALILGESGTGKELVARCLHDQSRRSNGPFIPVNMAALPRELAESTLFGHEKGAFTGADRPQVGCCEGAHQGTLFLDEIGEMDLALQAKLLRFLQERTVQRVGTVHARPVDVRVVAATNRDLRESVRERAFREDLYYRLNVVPIQVPPLRERREDIPLLARRFLQSSALRHRRTVSRFTDAALARLTSCNWLGNVRQLENLVERLAILVPGPEIDVSLLPEEIFSSATASEPKAPLVPPAQVPMAADAVASMDEVEKRAIIDALARTRGNVREAAGLLGLGQATVYRKIKRYGIVMEDRGRTPTVIPSSPGAPNP